MDKKTVLLIPAAKYVSEDLQTIGKLSPILYPIGDGMVYDWIYKQYADRVDSILVMTFEGHDKVVYDLKKYPKTVCIKLDKLEDLAHTIYLGIQSINCNLIINFADTIVDDDILETTDNCFYYSEDYLSDRWTYFKEQSGEITEIIDKTPAKRREKSSLFVGVFRITDSELFKRCLEKAFAEPIYNVSSFYTALMYYSRERPFVPLKTDNWFDIGHVDKYYNSKLAVESRGFNHIVIDQKRGILTKTSEDKDKFIGEIQWYLKIPSALEYCHPRIFSFSTKYDNPQISIEYYAYHTVHELFLYGDLSYSQWEKILSIVRFVYRDFNVYSVSNNHIVHSLKEMYLEKTLSRLEQLKNNCAFSNYFENPIVVNGEKYLSLKEIEEILKREIPKRLFSVNKFTVIHGDMCFTNILVDENLTMIKLIDPRGKFGSFDIYGDPRYELAKLVHSIDGKYDYIIKGLFEIHSEGNRIDFQFKSHVRDFDLYDLFLNIFSDEIGDEKDNIEFIESLLFLSMVPLHDESLDQQKVMVGTGLEILGRVCNIQVK